MTIIAKRSMRSKATIFTCTLATFLVNLDNTSLNVALPTIRSDLGGSISQSQWIADAYVLTLAAFVIVGGALGDRFDKKTVLKCGLGLYCVGTLASAVAPNMAALTFFRVVAGLGAAALVPVGLAAMKHISTTKSELTRNTALWGMVVGLGMTTGPLVGGILTSTLGWRYIFGFNCALGLCFLYLVFQFIPSMSATERARVDWFGQLMLSVTMVGLIFGIIEAPNESTRIYSAIALAVSASSLFILVAHLTRTEHPLIDLSVFRSRYFSGSMAVAVLNYFGVGATIFFAAFYFQDYADMSPAGTGFLLVPLALATAVAGKAAGWSLERWGPSPTVTFAGALITLGSALAVLATVAAPTLGTVALCAALAVMGLGFGLGNTPVNVLAMSELPANKSGVAGAAASASRQLGQSLGVAVIGALATAALPAMEGHTASVAVWVPWLSVTMAGLMVIAVSLFVLRTGRSVA